MQCASHKNSQTLQIYFEYSTTMTPHPSVQIYPECTVCVRKYENGTVLPEYYLFSMSMRQRQLRLNNYDNYVLYASTTNILFMNAIHNKT
jgi:hypothetical protein